jgi:alpha-methylacyl-CoA racemase
LEPKFYTELLKGLQLYPEDIPDRMDQNNWAALRDIFARKFVEKTQLEWEQIFDGTDSCVTAVHPLSDKMMSPIVRLSDTPGLEVSVGNVELLKAGSGGIKVLEEWLAWTLEKDYSVDKSGTVTMNRKAKL